ncbi:MAG: hypothetical protein EP329_12040, partial [Deltaproteobacteria bacterium]
MRRLGIVVGALCVGLLVGACGGKDKAAVADAAGPAPTPTTVAQPDGSATTEAPPATTVAPPATAEAAGDAEGGPEEQADTAAEAAAAPLPEAWQKTLKEGGCLGLSPDGATAYLVVTGKDADGPFRELFVTSVDADKDVLPLNLDALDADAVATAVREQVGHPDGALRPCRVVPAKDLAVADAEVEVRGGDDAMVTLFALVRDPDEEDESTTVKLLGAYDDGPTGSVFGVIAIHTAPADDDNASPPEGAPTVTTAALSAWDRGTAPCTPVPAGAVE